MNYTILDTESVKDFAESLIGMTFKATGHTKMINDVEYIELNTCDGELLFSENEIELVK